MLSTRYIAYWQDASLYTKNKQTIESITNEDIEALTRLHRGELHGLRFEKLHGTKKNIWSVRTNKKRRILVEIENNNIHVITVMENHNHRVTLKKHKASKKASLLKSLQEGVKTYLKKDLNEETEFELEEKAEIEGFEYDKTCQVVQKKLHCYKNHLFYFDDAQEEACVIQAPGMIVGEPGGGKTAANLEMIRRAVLEEGLEHIVFYSHSPKLAKKVGEEFGRDNPGLLTQLQPNQVVFHDTLSFIKTYWPAYCENKKVFGFDHVKHFLEKERHAENKLKNKSMIEKLDIFDIDLNKFALYNEFQLLAGMEDVDQYLVLGSRETNFSDPLLRSWIKEIYVKYQTYLNDEDAFDPTLLTWEVTEPQIDCLRGDEMQVAPRNMLLMLIRLTKNNNIIYFCDPNQGDTRTPVSPILENSLKKTGCKPTVFALSGSYRCQKHITPIINKLLLIRNVIYQGMSDKCAATEVVTKASQLPEHAGINWYTLSGLASLREELERNQTVFVVITHEALIEKAKIIFGDAVPVYSAADARGMEFDVVIAYEIFGTQVASNQKKFSLEAEINRLLLKNKKTMQLNRHFPKSKELVDQFEPYLKDLVTITSRAQRYLLIIQDTPKQFEFYHKELKESVLAGQECLIGVDQTFMAGNDKDWEKLAINNIKHGKLKQAKSIFNFLKKTDEAFECAVLKYGEKTKFENQVPDTGVEVDHQQQPRHGATSQGGSARSEHVNRYKKKDNQFNRASGKSPIIESETQFKEQEKTIKTDELPISAVSLRHEKKHDIGLTEAKRKMSLADLAYLSTLEDFLNKPLLTLKADNLANMEAIVEKIPSHLWGVSSDDHGVAPAILALFESTERATLFYTLLLNADKKTFHDKVVEIFSLINAFEEIDRETKSLNEGTTSICRIPILYWMYSDAVRALVMNRVLALMDQSGKKMIINVGDILHYESESAVKGFLLNGNSLPFFIWMLIKYQRSFPHLLKMNLELSVFLVDNISYAFKCDLPSGSGGYETVYSLLVKSNDQPSLTIMKAELMATHCEILTRCIDRLLSNDGRLQIEDELLTQFKTFRLRYFVQKILIEKNIDALRCLLSSNFYSMINSKLELGRTLLDEILIDDQLRFSFIEILLDLFDGRLGSDGLIKVHFLLNDGVLRSLIRYKGVDAPFIFFLLDHNRAAKIIIFLFKLKTTLFFQATKLDVHFWSCYDSSRFGSNVPLGFFLARYHPGILLHYILNYPGQSKITEYWRKTVLINGVRMTLAHILLKRRKEETPTMTEKAIQAFSKISLNDQGSVSPSLKAEFVLFRDSIRNGSEREPSTDSLIKLILLNILNNVSGMSNFIFCGGYQLFALFEPNDYLYSFVEEGFSVSLFYFISRNALVLTALFDAIVGMEGKARAKFFPKFYAMLVQPVDLQSKDLKQLANVLASILTTERGVAFLSDLLKNYPSFAALFTVDDFKKLEEAEKGPSRGVTRLLEFSVEFLWGKGVFSKNEPVRAYLDSVKSIFEKNKVDPIPVLRPVEVIERERMMSTESSFVTTINALLDEKKAYAQLNFFAGQQSTADDSEFLEDIQSVMSHK